MRYRDLIESDYIDDLETEVVNLLTAVSVDGIDEVNTGNLIRDLKSQGYMVDRETIMSVLDGLDIVTTATDDTIKISNNDANIMVGKDADRIETDRVDNLASKKATTDIGKDL